MEGLKIKDARKGLWGHEKGCFPFKVKKNMGLVEGKGPRRLSVAERSLGCSIVGPAREERGRGQEKSAASPPSINKTNDD